MQCRQKTVEVKGKCSTCTLFWCPRCLLNRYGEEVAAVNQLAAWACPKCRGACNCSNCRKASLLRAFHLASSEYAGMLHALDRSTTCCVSAGLLVAHQSLVSCQQQPWLCVLHA